MNKLRISSNIVSMVGRVHALARGVARHDADLARQIKRASASVGLNFAEGVHAPDGNRRSRLGTAIGSAREVTFALRIAGSCGYLSAESLAAELDRLDHITAVLWKLAYRKAA